MNELETARAIASGQISSPQIVAGFALWAIRITSTGTAERIALNEKVWRPPEVWLNPETLARIAALPVIFNHPDGTLTSEEYVARTVGTVQYAYIADETGIQNEIGPDIWAVCRLYDADMVLALTENKLSTSPSVSFKPTDGNQTIDLEDGSHLLLEATPSLLCHIAIVPNGVWDRTGGPSGIRSDHERTNAMTEEEKKAAEAKERSDSRLDAVAGNIDKLLTHMDGVTKRMDAMEEERKADKRRDAQSRRDAEREEFRKADAAACERDDSEEESEREKHKADGMDEDAAADKARKDRRDRMDARRKDAESEEEKEKKSAAEAKERDDKARKDAEEKAEKERADAIKADSQSSAALAATLANMPKSPNGADYAVFADAQATYDTTYQAFGGRAPGPLQGEAIIGYRRRLARGLQAHSAPWKSVDLAALPDAALMIAEGQIRSDAVAASRVVNDSADGELVKRVRTSETGHQITEFHGRTTIFKRLSAPTMRATAFNTERRA